MREAFQSAVLKDVDSTIVTPGVGDTPLMMSNEVGKMIMQFKTFFSRSTTARLPPASSRAMHRST